MKTTSVMPIPPEAPATSMQRLRGVAARRVEELLGELPATARSARTLLKVLALTIPIFGAGLLFVLWRLATR
jgi:DNA-directed RNA polymerase specialized sigma24 family protein